jgi:hypothetical protein
MFAGLQAVWRALRHLNHRGYVYIWANLLWVVLSLPLVTAPAAWAGMVRMSYLAHTRPTADLRDLWDGFRQNLRRGLVIFVLNVVLVGVNISNLTAYAGQTGLLYDIGRSVWIGVLVVWAAIQFYLWPLLYEMKQPSLKGALRNAAVMVYLNPVFTLAVLACAALIALLSTVFFASWLLISGGALAAIANSAVFDRLAAAGLRPPVLPPEAEIESFEG